MRALSRERKKELLAYCLIAPVIIYLIVFMLFPFIWALWTSVTNRTIGGNADFVGIDNFVTLVRDRVFRQSVWNTIVYTLFAVLGKVVLGMIMALVLNAQIPLKNLSRVLLFIPWTIPTLVSALTWRWMYSDVGGFFNYILMSLNIVNAPVPWLYDPKLAMVSIIVANIWRGAPFIAISLLAGLQSIPEDYYEAAQIDGANAIIRFLHITIPSIKDVLILSTLITTIWTFNDFEIVWLLTGGGPGNATQILSTYGYTVGFMNLNLSKAISSSMIAMPFLLILVTIITNRFKKSEVD
ncbi:MAG: sugar ABC transporter permease [Anaerolineaceae bacterium]|nr:MAG: sugar ABC transporter permease [Anaerolineaceae bacterium]